MYRDDDVSREARAAQLRRDITVLEGRLAKLHADNAALSGEMRVVGVGRLRGLMHWGTVVVLTIAFVFGALAANQLITRDRTVEQACPP